MGILKTVLALGILLVLLWLLVGQITGCVVRRVGAETEAKWFASMGEALQSPVPPGQQMDFDRAHAVLERLVETAEVRDLPFRLAYVDMPAVNAFAVPGGWIGVTRGFLEKVRTEEGVAFVLAHELGHHHHRHTLDKAARGVAFQAVLSLFDAGFFVEGGLKFAEASHSRDQEREADRFGLELVHEVYGELDNALEFLHLAAKDETSSIDFHSSHPLTRERIEDLEALARQLTDSND